MKHRVVPSLLLACSLTGAALWMFSGPSPLSVAEHGAGLPRSVPAAASPAAAEGIPPVETPAAPASPAAASLDALPPTEQATLWAALSQARHAVQPLTAAEAALPQNDGVHHFAANPGQQLTARFRNSAVTVASGRAGADWQATLHLSSVAGQAVSSHAAPAAEGARVEYRHAGGLTEWYVNRPEGIEHGFTLNHRPETAGDELRLEMAVDGMEVVETGADGQALAFAAGGTPVLGYEKLLVTDAAGREIPARMEATERGFAFLIADAGARYPVTIDPLIASFEAKLGPALTGDGLPGDRFGVSVALSGDTAVIGAQEDDGVAGEDVGSAYVFARSGGAWTWQSKLTAADGAAYEYFGNSVSVDGDTALIGAYLDDGNKGSAFVFTRSGTTWTQQAKLAVAGANRLGHSVSVSGDSALVAGHNSGGVYVFTRSGTSWSLQVQLVGTDTVYEDAFGHSVSLSGDTAIVGSPFDSTPAGESAGSAYVFTRSGTTWTQQQKLTASDGAAGHGFGRSVSLSADTALIGTTNGTNGSYAFVRSGTEWTQQHKFAGGSCIAVSGDTALVAWSGGQRVFTRSGTNWTQQATFGVDTWFFNEHVTSVALSGDTVLVGCPVEPGDATGAAYVFTRSGTAWTKQTKLTAGDGGAHDRFGYSVAVSGDTALVGAYLDDTAVGTDYGSVHVFVRAGTAWSWQENLVVPDGATHFGISVALSGDTALIGVGNGNDRAYVFTRGGTDWSEQALLMPNDSPGSGFGGSVSLAGDTALIGAPLFNGSTGCAYPYTRTGTAWTEGPKLTAADGAAQDFFGRSVSLEGDTALIGADGDDTGSGTDAGSAYVFTRSGTTWTQQQKLAAGDGAASDFFGRSVSLSGETALVGAYGDDSSAGSAHVFTRTGTVWTAQARLAAGDGAPSDFFGWSVSLSGDIALVGAYGDDTGELTNSGSAYVFQRVGTAWPQQVKLTAADAAASDLFGRSVSLSGDTAFVAADADDTFHPVTGDPAINQGSVHVFNLSEPWPAISLEQPSGTPLVNGAASVDFGARNVGSGGAPVSFTIRNTGTAPLLIPGATVTGANAGDFAIDTAGMLTTLAPAASTTFSVTFTPSSHGARSATLSIANNAGASFQIDLTGTGNAPVLAVERPAGTPLASGATTTFGTVAVGSGGSPVTYTLRNTGNVPLQLQGFDGGGTHAVDFPVDLSETSLTLAPGDSTTFGVIFSPTAPGARSATLAIASNAGPDFQITLAGTGTAPVLVVEQPAGTPLASGVTTNFASVTVGSSGSPVTYTVRNAGTAPLNLGGVSVTGTHSGDFAANTAGSAATVAPGATTTFSVTFSPSAAGARSAALSLASNAGSAFQIALAGTGNAPVHAVTVMAEHGTVTGGGDYPAGATATLTATAGAGYAFSHWSGDAGGTANPLEVVVNGPKNITAHFVPDAPGTGTQWVYSGYLGSPVPEEIAVPLKATAIAAGGNHTVALAQDGSVVAWGWNSYGQIAVPAGATSGVTAVATGGWHTAALKDGGVIAWGDNGAGQTTVPAAAQSGIVAVAVGSSHTVALKQDGGAIAWGYNVDGQATVPAAAQSGVISVAAGSEHTVALKQNGGVVAWGLNHVGQATVPEVAQSGVIAIAARGNFTVALKQDGSVVAWGDNSYGQTTVPAAAQSGVIAIAAGDYHTVALKQDGTIVTWGDNDYGQRTVPAAVQQSGVIAIAAGRYHTVVVKQDGTVVAWGYNEYGQTNVPAAGLTGVTAIAQHSRLEHVVALKEDGTVVAWGGNNAYGQASVPPEAQGSVTAVEAGIFHTVVLKEDGAVFAWGSNDYGQSTVPAAAQSGVTAIAAGNHHTVALKNGAAIAWGRNDWGQTSIPTAAQSGVVAIKARGEISVALKADGSVIVWGTDYWGHRPVPPAAQSGVIAIAVGATHVVALRQDGTVISWGANSPWGENNYGQATVPEGLAGVTAIAAGGIHSAAMKEDGSVVIWGATPGDFNYGQTAVPAAAQSGVTGIAAMASATFFRIAAGTGGAPELAVEQPENTPLANGISVTDFGNVGLGQSSGPVTYTLRNTGDAPLEISGIAPAGGDDGIDFTVDLSGTAMSLAPGGNTTFRVVFTPSGEGERTSTITIGSNAGDDFIIGVTGTGHAAVVVPFTPGNLVIYRVGRGGTALANTGAEVFLDEYSPAGVRVQSIPLPTEAAGANRRLVASGTATAEGGLTLSADGRFLVLTGYDAAIPHAGSLPGTSSTAVNRVIGTVDPRGGIRTVTAPVDFADAGSPRSAATLDGSSFWMVGSTGGIRHAVLGETAASVQLATTPANLRQVSVFGGQLYLSSATTGFPVRIGTVGSGLPVTAGQTVTNLPGFPDTGNPHAFHLADLSAGVPGADTLYVADETTGLRKFSLVAGTWTNNGTIGSDADDYRGLTAMVNGTEVTLYTTRKGGASAAGGGDLIRVTDSSGHGGAFTATPALLATAAENTAFRGIALAPEGPLLAVEEPAGTPLAGGSSTTDFGGANVGTPGVTKTYTVRNDGTGVLQITGAALTGDHAGDFTLDSSPVAVTLAPGESATFGVSFSPSAAGARSAALSIAGDGIAPFGIALTGFGAAPVIVVEQPAGTPLTAGSTADFGAIPAGTAGTPRIYTLRNTGNAPLQVQGIGIGGTHAGDFPVNLAGTSLTLAPGAATTFSVIFSPTAPGARSATLSIASNTGTDFLVALTGTGTAPQLVVEQPSGTPLASGATTSFGPVPTGGGGTTVTYTLRNAGTALLVVSGIAKSGPHGGDFLVDSSGTATTLASAATTTFSVTFSPSAAGERSAALSITTNAPGSPFTLALSGTGETTGTAPVTHASTGYRPGENAVVEISIDYIGQALSALGHELQLPAGWSYVSDTSNAAAKPVAGQTGLLEWAWFTVPEGGTAFAVTLLAPAGAEGDQAFTGAATLAAPSGAQTRLVAQPDPLVLEPLPSAHSADLGADFRINLSELLGVISLYNHRNGATRTGEYHRSGAAYAPGPGVQTPPYHSTDTSQDWRMNLTELLGTISLYNHRDGTVRTGEYHYSASQSRFVPGPAPEPAPQIMAAKGVRVPKNGFVLAADMSRTSGPLDPAGGTLTLEIGLGYPAAQVSALGVELEIPAGWSFVSSTGGAGVSPAPGQNGTLEWAWFAIPQAPLAMTVNLAYPAGANLDGLAGRAIAANLAGDQQIAPLVLSLPYETWAATVFGGDETADRTRTGDPDGDGLENLVEYALGLSPVSTDAPPVTVSPAAGNQVTVSYERPEDGAEGISYALHRSTTLMTWDEIGEPQIVPLGAGRERVTLTLERAAGGKEFFKLEVVEMSP